MSNRKEIRDLVVFDCKGVTPKYVKHSNTIVLNQKCIKEFKLDYSLAQFISQEQKISEEKYLKVGDIVINSTGQGTAGRCAIVSYIPDGYKVTVDSHMLIIRCLDINTDYILAYNIYLNESYIMKLLTGSSGQAELDKVRLYNINIAIPKNKKTFKDFLVLIQNKIENNNKINEELEAMAKTIYDYWFLQFEFPNEEGKPYKSSGGKMVWNEELKKEIPEGWEFGSLKNILSELECGNRPKGGCNDSIKYGVPSIGAENIISIGKYDFSSEKYISKDYYLSLKKGIVKSNDVLLYKDGAGVGKSSMAKNNFPYEECAVNSHVFILRTKENNLYQNYLYLTLQKEYIKKILIDLSMKAAQPGLNQPSVESVPILIPSTDIIVKFNNIIDILFNKIFSNSNENKELTSLRDFLLPLLMNGQVGFKELALAED